jgi:signal transduction histidine kinase
MDEINAHEELANGGGAGEEPRTIRTPPALNTEWLASLSHELRSPLTAIQGYTSLLRRHDARISSEERQEFLQAISEGSNRIASILDRFLDIASLEAGTTQLHLLPVDLAQLVREALLTTQQECPDNNVSFTIKPGSDPTPHLDHHPFVINADASLIHKMLIQLLDNARKYSAASAPIEVTLSCTSLSQKLWQIPPQIRAQLLGHDQGHDQKRNQGHDQRQGQAQGHDQRQGQALPLLIELSVQDRGIGIPKADHERIFERFERVDMQLTRNASGLGLGLTMCKHIVALHHGAIWVESTPGEGSTFHVLLPTG